MARIPKEAPKSSPPKEAPKSAPPRRADLPSDDPQALLQAARAEMMRAQRDLESVRLELVEQKRKSSQHALVHAEELKEARAEREQLRMQIVALKGELADLAAPGKKRAVKREEEENGRFEDLEKELAEARAESAKERATVARLQKAQSETLTKAQERGTKLDGLTLQITQKAGPDGRLFGSVTNYDIVEALQKQGHEVERANIRMPQGPLKQVGDFPIQIALHTDVTVTITVSVLGEQ